MKKVRIVKDNATKILRIWDMETGEEFNDIKHMSMNFIPFKPITATLEQYEKYPDGTHIQTYNGLELCPNEIYIDYVTNEDGTFRDVVKLADGTCIYYDKDIGSELKTRMIEVEVESFESKPPSMEDLLD